MVVLEGVAVSYERGTPLIDPASSAPDNVGVCKPYTLHSKLEPQNSAFQSEPLNPTFQTLTHKPHTLLPEPQPPTHHPLSLKFRAV